MDGVEIGRGGEDASSLCRGRRRDWGVVEYNRGEEREKS